MTIKKQMEEISSADYVVSLFPDVQEYMQKKCNREVLYLGNVINSELIEFSPQNIIKKKFESNHYLFIGRKHYIKSAITLVKAIEIYNSMNEEKVYVDIIGLKKEDDVIFEKEFVTCYGYLSKGNDKEKQIYYDCILSAKAIVNVTKNWNGMSSLIEAMYYDTPIIVVPNDNTIKTFGDTNTFGVYCNEDSESDVNMAISKIQNMNFNEYADICQEAHNKVSSFTWLEYVKKIVALFDNK